MRMRRISAVVLAVVLLGGCTGGDDSDPVSPTSPAASGEAGGDSWTAAELARVTLDVEADEDDVLGEVEGGLYQVNGGDIPARIAVTEVMADEYGTTLRFVLRTLDGGDVRFDPYPFNKAKPLTFDIRDLALVDPVAETRLQPFLGTNDPESPGILCTCSRHPTVLSGVGVELAATFPPRDASTQDVVLEFPGFPALERMPVTRR